MPPRSHSARRAVELGAVTVVIALPIALIAATWAPLEPPPRGGRARAGNEISVPATNGARANDKRRPRKVQTRTAKKDQSTEVRPPPATPGP